LTIIGVTGTDGKTTTVAMTAHILHEAGIRVGAVSTSFFRIGGTIENNPTHKTSLTPSELQRFLKRCVREGCTTVVVEASSHGLVQHRVDFLWPKVAAITNTSPEHLDYHGTMEQYRKDKGILFRMLRPNGIAVLNADDETHALYRTIPAGWRIDYSSTKSLVASHSANECAFSAKNIHEAHGEVSAHVRCNAEDVEWHLRLPMTGRFNVDNALCAISCAHAVSIPSNIAVHALSSFTGVPGRMERIDEGQNFHVFVDFTVTPGAYEKTLSSVRQMLPLGKRLLVLTGSCGDRMVAPPSDRSHDVGSVVPGRRDGADRLDARLLGRRERRRSVAALRALVADRTARGLSVRIGARAVRRPAVALVVADHRPLLESLAASAALAQPSQISESPPHAVQEIDRNVSGISERTTKNLDAASRRRWRMMISILRRR
jgi:hypothetical protein